MKDWTGNNKSAFTCLGASNHSLTEREKNDYYATHPSHVEELLKLETFNKNIWECAVGGGHIANVLEKHGYNVYGTDIVNRGWRAAQYYDFLNMENNEIIMSKWHGDIITNPPYKYAKYFIQNAIKVIDEGNKIAMFLKLTFLEGQARKQLFNKYPPKTIYVYSKRALCAKNGKFEKYPSSAIAYAWFIWEKGFKGNPIIKWI